jgi:hypothetical protein
MGNFPWAKLLSMLGPILALIFGSLSASNVADIQYGAAEATIGNYTLTGGAGLASLVSLVTGLVASWRANGRVSAGEAAETAALGTLSVICLSRGDAEGGRLVDQLGKHLHLKRNPSDAPETGNVIKETPEELFSALVKRLNYEAARKVEEAPV